MNNDLISRQEAIETLKQLILQGTDERLKNDYEAIDLAIKALERPQGEWKYLDNQIYCNLCNRTSFSESNFCSNCGAKMRKGGAE